MGATLARKIQNDRVEGSLGLLTITAAEWTQAERVVVALIQNGSRTIPFKLSRKELTGQAAGLPAELMVPDALRAYINHSFIVIPTNEEPGYKIGAIARNKLYTNAEGENVHDGILEGIELGTAKIVQWRDGSVDAVKIEAAEAATEQVPGVLARFKTAIGWPKKIEQKNKKYTIQQQHIGINMQDYLKDNPVETMSIISRCEIGSQAVQAIQQLHAQNILHCDIKPENFMINTKGELYGK